MKSFVAIVMLACSMMSFADEAKTDFPVEILGDLNGMTIPRTKNLTTGGLIKDGARFLSSWGDANKAKKKFFQAVGELLEIIDKDDFTQLARDYGYEIFSGSELKRKVDISGFYNADGAPTMNDAVSRVCNICLGPIGNTKDDLDDILALNWYDKSFELALSALGQTLFDFDLYIDRGDVTMIEAMLEAAKGALYLLRGMDLDMTYEEMIAAITKLSNDFGADDLDLVAAFDASPFARFKVKSMSDLQAARAAFVSAIALAEEGDELVLSRNDGLEHLIQYETSDFGDIVQFLLNNENTILSCLDQFMSPVDISNADVITGPLQFTYTGKPISVGFGKPTVGGVAYPCDVSGTTTAVNVDEYEIVLTGYGRSTGSKTIRWKIVAPPERTVTYNDATGEGDVRYVLGTTVTARPRAELGGRLTNIVCVGWVGTGDVPASGTANEVTFTVTQPSSLTWLYQTNYWVSAAASSVGGTGGGSVMLTDADGIKVPMSGWYSAGTNLIAVATANEGWRFLSWTLSSQLRPGESDAKMPFTVNAPVLLTAEFEPRRYDVDIGDVRKSNYAYGETVAAATFAEKTEGYTNIVCVGWIGTGDVPATGIGTQVTFTVTQPSSLKWLYATNYWVSVTASEGGSVALTDATSASLPNGAWYSAGTNLVAEVTADEGCEFVEWVNVDGGQGLTALPMLIDHPWMVAAKFAKLQYAVTFDLGEHGKRSGGGELSQTVVWGKAAVEPEVKADKDFEFDGWDAAFGCVKSNFNVRAKYLSLMPYVGVAVAEGCGNMGKVSGANKSVKSGAKLTLRATANRGYALEGWYEGESTDRLTQSANLSMVAGYHDVTYCAKFIATTSDWANVSFKMDDEYANGVAMTPVAVVAEGGSLPTVKVTGLPTGLKFTAKDVYKKGSKTVVEYAANTIYGTPTKSGVYTVVATVTTAGKVTASCSQMVVVRKQGENVVKVEVPSVEGSVPGKVTGAGVYVAGKKVTLRATANKGYVFMGWYDGEGIVSKAASHVIDKMPAEDVKLTAKFVTAERDKSSIAAGVNGVALTPWESKTETHAYATNIWAGVYLEWPVAASALSMATVKVAGLPSGLKFDAKANRICGVPSAASKKVKVKGEGEQWKATPSQVKVTVTTTGKSSQTYQIDMTVDPLPAWAQGTFTGPSYSDAIETIASTNGTVSVTIGANGKISAKQPVNGKTASFAANGFDRYDADRDAFCATLTAKVGKEVFTNEMELSYSTFRVSSSSTITNGYIEAARFDAWQYNWKVEPCKSFISSLANQTTNYYVKSDGTVVDTFLTEPTLGTNDIVGKVTMKFAASGAVSVAGEFAKLDADGNPVYKNNKLQTVKATGSSTMVPVGNVLGAGVCVFVYLAPKDLAPHACYYEISLYENFAIVDPGFRPVWPGDDHWYICFKPVVYLYPETNAVCNVRVDLDGELTCTYPDYGIDGWRDFIASPDGTLTFGNGSRYYCLFWEGQTNAKWDFSHGYCVKGSETASFLADVLLEMGLSFREANEFIVYWLPQMQDNPYNVIAFQGENYANAAKLEIEPQPDSVLRVFMAWHASAEPVDIPAPVIEPFERKGFTVVEWGGTAL